MLVPHPQLPGVRGAAGGVVVLTKLLADRPTALIAGTLFAVLPRTTWAAAEARSFAFSALAAVWLTVVLVVAARCWQPQRRWLHSSCTPRTRSGK
jgi:mannosyltransferase